MHRYIGLGLDYKKIASCIVQKGLPGMSFMTFLIALILPSTVCLAARDGERFGRSEPVSYTHLTLPTSDLV